MNVEPLETLRPKNVPMYAGKRTQRMCSAFAPRNIHAALWMADPITARWRTIAIVMTQTLPPGEGPDREGACFCQWS